jgi:septal ring factor EnvC (AmiA/AmiB activator)
MSPPLRSGLLLAVVTSLLVYAVNARAQLTEKDTEAQLEALQLEISEIQRNILTKQNEQGVLQTRLADAEKSIGKLAQRLRTIEQQIARELPRLAALEEERDRLQDDVVIEQKNMTRDFRALWALREGGGLRILFGDQSPNEMALNLAYFNKLLQQRSEAVARYQALLLRVQNNANALRISQVELAQQSAALEKERERATDLQTERRLALAAIEKSLSSDSVRVAKLEQDQAQLGDLLDELRQRLSELEAPSAYVPFDNAKGKMIFPAQGKVSNRFGASRNSGDMVWRGWLIPAPAGSNVLAVHYGRVVYADWLRGQGLLIILDHGEGYFSLYGQNRSLRREVGDWVAPGETIATVGASGGALEPGLYFEIRSEGKPVDPGRWIKR